MFKNSSTVKNCNHMSRASHLPLHTAEQEWPVSDPERARAARAPLTMSSAKLETPAPRVDWVTQRYRSCSALDTTSSWNVARKRRWLMCFTEAAGTTSPLCLCPRDTRGVTGGTVAPPEPPGLSPNDVCLKAGVSPISRHVQRGFLPQESRVCSWLWQFHHHQSSPA